MTSAICRIFWWLALMVATAGVPGEDVIAGQMDSTVDRSPVDLVLAFDGSWLATANQTSDSVSLVRVSDGQIVDEIRVGRRPTAIEQCPDGQTLLVSSSDSGELTLLGMNGTELQRLATIRLGFQPHGIAISPDGTSAYVALTAASQVAVVDLQARRVVDRMAVGRWPRHLAVSSDDTKLAVGTSGDRGVSIIDLKQRKLQHTEQFFGLNIGHMSISADDQYVYFPWVVYRRNPVTAANIRQGWVLATRIGRVRLDGPARREAVSLDPEGQAVADPHGLALSRDEQRLVVSASGTHELLVYRVADLPFVDYGSTDHIPPALLNNQDSFYRIELGGRPMGLRMGPDDQTVYVANYLNSSVQVVDLRHRRLTRTIFLGGPREPSLARRGESIFYDAQRSLDQWYSCHTCHYDGGTNAVVMDTFNDKTPFTFKTVLPLQNVTNTRPWTWHGWQNDLPDAMRQSLTTTMVGPEPTQADVEALIAYFESLRLPENPFLLPDGSRSEAAERGERVFQSDQANCISCHSGPNLTDGDIHDVDTGHSDDRLEGYNTPSLLGSYRKVAWLHDGRADSLEGLLTGPHSPARVSATRALSEAELRDLVQYLLSL